MSAYVCSDLHINTLVSWAAANGASFYAEGQHQNIRGQEARVAGLLYTANVESVNARYQEDKPSCEFKFERIFSSNEKLPAVHVLCLCNCLSYQSCEVDGYDKTIGYTIVQAIKEAAIRKLPGYNDAPWGL